MKYGFLSLCNTILVCLFFGYCQDSHSGPSGVFCSVGMCFPGLHRLAGLPSAEGWADTAGPGSTFVTGWKAGRHKASLLLWMNWATCWYPGVELGLGLPGRSLPGFFPLSCPLAEKANFSFFLPTSLLPSFSSFLSPFLSFFFLPCLCYWWFWVVGLSMSQLGVGDEKKAQESHHIVVPQILSFSTQPLFFPSFRVLLSLSF